MKNKLKKINTLIVQKGLSLVAVFAMLVVSIVAVIPLSLGWFAKNEQVTANGMHLNAYDAKFSIEYADEKGTKTDLDKIMQKLRVPGQKVTFDITVKNVGLYDVELTSIGLEAPTHADEKPLVKDGGYYYLSTELSTKVDSAKVTKGKTVSTIATSDGVADRRLRDENLVAGRINYFDWLENQSVTLGKGDSITLTVTIEFVDTGEEQNDYKYFASKGLCKRSIFITYN